MMFDLREGIQRVMFLGIYEPEQTKWTIECIAYGVFIDIGASFGYYTTLCSGLVEATGKVFAFEPSPLASNALENIIHNSNFKNVTLVRSPVGKENDYIKLFLPSIPDLYSPSILEGDPSFTSCEIPVAPRDNFELLSKFKK